MPTKALFPLFSRLNFEIRDILIIFAERKREHRAYEIKQHT